MSGERNGSPGPYRVSAAGHVLDHIQQLSQQAAQAGLADRFTAALKTVVQRLQADPFAFGEVIKHTPGLKLPIHAAQVLPVRVQFAIHDVQRVVFIIQVELLTP